jgi:hypothetical protein
LFGVVEAAAFGDRSQLAAAAANMRSNEIRLIRSSVGNDYDEDVNRKERSGS